MPTGWCRVLVTTAVANSMKRKGSWGPGEYLVMSKKAHGQSLPRFQPFAAHLVGNPQIFGRALATEQAAKLRSNAVFEHCKGVEGGK